MSKPVISVGEARRILGPEYDKYPDEFIEQLIENLNGIAQAFIKSVPE